MSSSFLLAAFPFDVRPGEVESNLALVLGALEQAAAAGAGLLCLPEKWTTSFLPSYSVSMVAASEKALAEVNLRAAALNLTVVGSAPAFPAEPPAQATQKPYNELHFLGLGGDRRPYRKRILFSPTGEGRQVTRGTDLPLTLETSVGKVCAWVCYDLRFPELTRQAFYAQADLVLVPAQWPHPRTEIFELLARARAAENQTWLLACNRAGIAGLGGKHLMDFPGSAVLVDPLGKISARVDDGSLLLAPFDHLRSQEARKKVPCARDLRQAGLWPSSEAAAE
jgi:predicted amidohydrolase